MKCHMTETKLNENLFYRSGIFFKGHHSSHDDYGKTIDDIEKYFFYSTANLKSSVDKFCEVDLTSGSPDINRNVIF